jgi:ubiquinone/menaquinone biosynthesis C-methylase UbiE
MRVLDVGCGTGAALVPAAEAVGPTGHVLGLDLAAGMVRRAKKVVADHHWTHVEVEAGDAEDPAVAAGDWDRVIAAQVLFFLPRPDLAISRYHQLLAFGGKLAFSTWGPENPAWSPVYRALFGRIPEGKAPQLTPAHETFRTEERISALVEDAGFVDVRHVTVEHDIVYSGVDQWLDWNRSHGARAYWDAIPASEVAASRADAAAVLDGLRAPDGHLHMGTSVRYTVATRP